MRDYSSSARRKINATSGEAPVVLLEITHPDLEAPIRVAQDNQDLLHQGNLFVAFAFEIDLPDDQDKQTPRASIAMDNVGRELTQWLEASDGGDGAQVRVMQVMRSDPDVVEWEVTLDLSNVSMDVRRVTGDLSFEDLLNRPGVLLRYDPQTAPGLF
jgi:hypothetical protein